VYARLDMAAQMQKGALTIDRATNLVEVRPLRRRRVYALPLDWVAHMICRHVIMTELQDKRREKADRLMSRMRRR
jgi:hypothetical protein